MYHQVFGAARAIYAQLLRRYILGAFFKEERKMFVNPFKLLVKRDWVILIFSLVAVIVSNLATGDIEPLTFAAALIGVTSLIFVAKGNVWGQVLIIIFSIMYGMISYNFRYWGEMATYLGMTLPIAVWALITWLKNPSKENEGEVEIARLTPKKVIIVLLISAAATAAFYVLLKKLDTPNLLVSTVSVTTSCIAALFMMLRSSLYALGYAVNDLVLVVLWILASITDIQYVPVVVNFAIFFLNDIYGFISWKKREKGR